MSRPKAHKLLTAPTLVFNTHCRFLQLISLVPTDPHILQRLGEMYDQEGDRLQAYQYHYEVLVHTLYICMYIYYITYTTTPLAANSR